MRSVLSVSLPAEKKKAIEWRAKKANKTTSAYVMYLFELEENLISEDELVLMAAKSEKDYKAGKTNKLKGLADLME